MRPKGRVSGIGGVFLRARRPKRLARWYRDQLGLAVSGQIVVFQWRSPRRKGGLGHTVWALLGPREYDFGSRDARAMLSYRVPDLDRVLVALRWERVKVDHQVEESRYGRFVWVTDPEGNRVELWESSRRYVTPEPQVPME